MTTSDSDQKNILASLFSKQQAVGLDKIVTAAIGSPLSPAITGDVANAVQYFFQSVNQTTAAHMDMVNAFIERNKQMHMVCILAGRTCTAVGMGPGHIMYNIPVIEDVQELYMNQVVHNSVRYESTSAGLSTELFQIGVSHDEMDADHIEKFHFITSSHRTITFESACYFCGFRQTCNSTATVNTRSLNQAELRQYLVELQTKEMAARQRRT